MSIMHRKLKWRLQSTGTEIIHDDDELLVLNKPANLLVLPDRFRHDIKNLYTILTEELGKVFVVHRIDKETSGVILFAKTAEVHAALNEQFEHRMVEKVYMGIVAGVPQSDAGRIDAPIAENGRDAGVMKVSQRTGKEAVTEYRVLEQFNGYAMVELRPRTGRTHQIRVHLQFIGTPLLSDRTYGDGRPFFLSHIKPGYRSVGEEKPLLDRTALHAFAISFDHPRTGERTNLMAELPKDMNSVLRYLRKFRLLQG
jgi:23S rRNA pseudouridine1911/1915/1917 synthase